MLAVHEYRHLCSVTSNVIVILYAAAQTRTIPRGRGMNLNNVLSSGDLFFSLQRDAASML